MVYTARHDFQHAPLSRKVSLQTSYNSKIFRLCLGITIEAEGTEHLESYEGGYILSPNHQSSLDTMCIARYRTVFISQPEFFSAQMLSRRWIVQCNTLSFLLYLVELLGSSFMISCQKPLTLFDFYDFDFTGYGHIEL